MTAIVRARATLNGWSGAPGLYTAYFIPGTVGGSIADATDVLARVRAFWNAVSGILPAAVTVATASSVDVINDADGSLVGSFPSTTPPTVVTGTGVGDFYAPQCCALLQMTTGIFVRGRRVTGRSFINPLNEAAVGAGQLSVATSSTISGAALTNLTPGAPPTTSKLCVWRRPKPGSPGASFQVTAFAVPLKIATLKSRRDG